MCRIERKRADSSAVDGFSTPPAHDRAMDGEDPVEPGDDARTVDPTGADDAVDGGTDTTDRAIDGDGEDALDAALGRAWRDDASWRLLEGLTAIEDRLGGGPGERAAADLVAEAFAAAGLADVRIDPFEMSRWTRGRTELAVVSGGRERSVEGVALPYSPAAEVRGPLVDVGHGTPAEIEAAGDALAGGVALARTAAPPDAERSYHRMEKVGEAVAAGAEAFLFVNHVPGQLPPTGSLGSERAPIPGVGVSKETGARLADLAGDATVRLRVEADTAPGTSRNVRARLPAGEGAGTGGDADPVLVLAHYDAHDVGEGALDNGCGVATALGALRILADAEVVPAPVEVAAVGSEELGLLGSEALAERLDLDRVRAVVNVDGAGRDRDLRALTHGSDAVGAVVASVADDLDRSVGIDDDPHPYSDHWPFVRAGVPALQLHSDDGTSDRWDRGWTHTRADTLDKADPRTIRDHAMVTALLVRALASEPVERLDPAALRARLVEDGAEPGLRAAGMWPAAWEA